MAFNLINFKSSITTAGTGNDVFLGNVSEQMLDQADPFYNPYGRRKKKPGGPDNRNQFGDQGDSALGPASGGGGIEPGVENGQEATKQYDQWFKGHDNLKDRQTVDGGHGSKPFMSDGSKGTADRIYMDEPSDAHMSPLSYSADIFDQVSKHRDNPSPSGRLPGSGLSNQKKPQPRDRRSVKAFNQLSRSIDTSPLLTTWAHIKKGRAF